MDALPKSVTRGACQASLLALAAGLAVSSPAHAQGGADSSYSGVAEIIVTAQKREQSVQDVPIAVTALGGDALQANRVTSFVDLTGLAPGLISRANAGGGNSPSYILRGVFASAAVPSQDRQISTYIDGVYVGGTRGAISDLPDLERIEVLRGPQGTLFGRNATAGAISITTRDPTGEFGIRQELTVGNFDQLRSRTTVNTPQLGIFSAYLTYVHDEKRGDTRNLGAGTTFDRTTPFAPNLGVTHSPKWLGSKNDDNIFGAVKMEPSSDFSLTYKFYRLRHNFTPEARASTVINSSDFTGGILAGVLAAQPAGGGAYGSIVLNPSDKRPKAINNAWTIPGFVKASGHTVTLDWQATDRLSFKNITAYRETENIGVSSIMGTDGLEYTAAAKEFYTLPRDFLGGASYAQALSADGSLPVGSYFAGYTASNYGKYRQISNELQANYESDLVTLTVGALWYSAKERASGVGGMQPNIGFRPVPQLLPLGNDNDLRTKTTSLAAYAQAEVHVTPKLDLTLGARVTRDKKDNVIYLGGVFNGPADRSSGTLDGQTVVEVPFKKTKPTYAIGANYKVNDDVLVYGKFSTAFLSGGATGPLAFEPETVKSWEAGLKSEWFDRRLQFNLALYHATYKHSQSAQSGRNVTVDGQNLGAYAVVVIDNGTVKAKGVEVDLVAVPVDGLTLGGTLGYTDTKWVNPSPFLTTGRPVKPTAAPKVVGSVNAQYVTPPLWDEASILFRIDGVYQSKYRATPFTDWDTVAPALAPFENYKSRWIFNSRVALRDINFGAGNAEIGLWSRNLFNNKDALYTVLFGAIENDSSYVPARTWGVDLIVELGG